MKRLKNIIVLKFQLQQTPVNDFLSPQMEIRAIAGPMNKEQAEVSETYTILICLSQRLKWRVIS